MNELSSKPQSELQKIIQDAEKNLEPLDHSPFSPQAFDLLKDKIGEYTAQLISESIKLSNRNRTDTVSSRDVEHASQYLVSSNTNKIYRHVGTMGGILLGAGLSTALSMVQTNQYTTNGVLVSIILVLIGTFMVALQVAKD